MCVNEKKKIMIVFFGGFFLSRLEFFGGRV